MNRRNIERAATGDEVADAADRARLEVLRAFRENVREALTAHFQLMTAAMAAGDSLPRPTLTPIDHALAVADEELDAVNALQFEALARLGVR